MEPLQRILVSLTGDYTSKHAGTIVENISVSLTDEYAQANIMQPLQRISVSLTDKYTGKHAGTIAENIRHGVFSCG